MKRFIIAAAASALALASAPANAQKITSFQQAATPFSGQEFIYLTQGGAPKKTTLSTLGIQLGLAFNGPFVTTLSPNKFGSPSGDYTAPAPATTNIQLYFTSSTKWSGIASDANGSMYFVTGNGSPATRMVIDVNTGDVHAQTGGFTGPYSAPAFRLDTKGYTFGQANTSAPTANPVQIVNTYSGAPLADAVAIFSRTDYQPNATDSTNPVGTYGTLWLDAPVTFTGSPSAVKGNAYIIPQITATVQSGGSNNQVGDVLTITGGTCNNSLNTAPTFGVTGVTGGAVTTVTFFKGTGSCGTYPSNPVTTTSSRGGATPPTLNLTVASSPTVANVTGTYGRVRNESSGTITNALAIFADGLYNTGAGGVVTNAYGVFIEPPHTTGNTPPVNDYGLFFDGAFATGSIAAVSGSDITVKTSGGGRFNVLGSGSVFGTAGGSYTAPTDNNTNVLLYHISSTNYAGFGVHSDGGIYAVTGTSAPATRWQILMGGGVQIGPVRATLTDGALGFNKISASGSLPGAGTAKLEVVAGTNAGTCKLIMYAGTSTTPSTVLDNVGSGC